MHDVIKIKLQIIKWLEICINQLMLALSDFLDFFPLPHPKNYDRVK